MSDHPTEIPPFRWDITARQCYKLFDCGRLAVALLYTEFQAVPRDISMTQGASFPLGWMPLPRCRHLPVSISRMTGLPYSGGDCRRRWYIVTYVASAADSASLRPKKNVVEIQLKFRLNSWHDSRQLISRPTYENNNSKINNNNNKTHLDLGYIGCLKGKWALFRA